MTVFKRKFRWTLAGTFPSGKFKAVFCKIAARPNLVIEETEIAGVHIPVKHEWQELTATVWDTNELDWDVITPITALNENDNPPTGEFILSLYDGCGWLLEEWHLKESYIKKTVFTDDYSPDDRSIEFVISYELPTTLKGRGFLLHH